MTWMGHSGVDVTLGYHDDEATTDGTVFVLPGLESTQRPHATRTPKGVAAPA